MALCKHCSATARNVRVLGTRVLVKRIQSPAPGRLCKAQTLHPRPKHNTYSTAVLQSVGQSLEHLLLRKCNRLTAVYQVRSLGVDVSTFCCAGLTLAGCPMPTQPLSHSLSSAGEGEEQDGKCPAQTLTQGAHSPTTFPRKTISTCSECVYFIASCKQRWTARYIKVFHLSPSLSLLPRLALSPQYSVPGPHLCTCPGTHSRHRRSVTAPLLTLLPPNTSPLHPRG